LLQQQSGGGAIQGSTAVAVQAVAFPRSPTAGVFIHQGQGQIQVAGQAFAITAAVHGLIGGLLLRVER
jgi:hypothetical protein